MYSAFLQEASKVLNNGLLNELSARMTRAGDRWRDFALMGSRHCKNRASKQESCAAMADVLRDCADQEKSIYIQLLSVLAKDGYPQFTLKQKQQA
jgi:hypothetical protein